MEIKTDFVKWAAEQEGERDFVAWAGQNLKALQVDRAAYERWAAEQEATRRDYENKLKARRAAAASDQPQKRYGVGEWENYP